MKFFLTSLVMIFPHFNSKANKDMNGNMDSLQMMVKSSFLLSKNSKVSQWICFCLWRTIVFQWTNGWSFSNRTWILHDYSKSTKMHHTQTNLSNSEHSCAFIWFHYEQVCTLLPCITALNDLQLFLQIVNRNTLQLMPKLKKTIMQHIILRDIQMNQTIPFHIGIQH